MQNKSKKPLISLLIVIILLTTPFSGINAAAVGKNTESLMLVPVGSASGLTISSGGVLIVGLSEVNTPNGSISPAAEAGLHIGDVITAIGQKTVSSTADLRDAISGGGTYRLKVLREGKEIKLKLKTALSEDGTPKIGAWVRDSISGIGTITFYDPKSGLFGALGHGISDSHSYSPIPLGKGSLLRTDISEIRKGEYGIPGELKGELDQNDCIGDLYLNTEFGIFGTASAEDIGAMRSPIEVASPEQVKAGPATILSCVSGHEVVEYSIEISSVNLVHAPRDMVIKITDQKLLDLTGGIVQGMSGSPIIQNGKLVGAVTHVFVNDPTQGYGVFITNMIDAAKKISTDSTIDNTLDVLPAA